MQQADSSNRLFLADGSMLASSKCIHTLAAQQRGCEAADSAVKDARRRLEDGMTQHDG